MRACDSGSRSIFAGLEPTESKVISFLSSLVICCFEPSQLLGMTWGLISFVGWITLNVAWKRGLHWQIARVFVLSDYFIFCFVLTFCVFWSLSRTLAVNCVPDFFSIAKDVYLSRFLKFKKKTASFYIFTTCHASWHRRQQRSFSAPVCLWPASGWCPNLWLMFFMSASILKRHFTRRRSFLTYGSTLFIDPSSPSTECPIIDWFDHSFSTHSCPWLLGQTTLRPEVGKGSQREGQTGGFAEGCGTSLSGGGCTPAAAPAARPEQTQRYVLLS